MAVWLERAGKRGEQEQAADKIPVHRHPMNNYRLFKVSDLEKLFKTTGRSATKPKRKPR